MLAPSARVLLVEVAVGLLLFAWGRWVASRRRTVMWRAASGLPFAGLLLGLLGLALSAGELMNAWQARDIADPAAKADVLARTVQHLVMLTLVSQPLLCLCYLAAVVVFVLGSASVPKRRSQTVV